MHIKNTINKVNPQQTPIDVSDQPVYALSKEIQWRFNDQFGRGKYFVMFGALHIEKSLLVIHADIIKGSDLRQILKENELSVIGTDAIVNVNDIKKARYCLQVIEFHEESDMHLVVTKGDSILTNSHVLITNSRINKCTSEEADARLVRHTIDCVETGYGRIVVRTVDTYVLVLLIGNIPYMKYLGVSEIFALLGLGSLSYYNVTQIALKYGDEIFKALPFQYAFSGCDTTSSFFNMGKCKWFDYWMCCPEKSTLTSVFIELSNRPTVK